MKKQEIRQLVYQLDKEVPKDDAVVEFTAFGETGIYATQNGYLRLGIEFMKRAFEGRSDGECLDYLMSKDSNFTFDWIETDKKSLDQLRK